MDVTVAPVQRLRGAIAVPGDKSVSHRALILAAMAGGRCVIRGAAPGADVASTLDSLRRLLAITVQKILALEGHTVLDGNAASQCFHSIKAAVGDGFTMIEEPVGLKWSFAVYLFEHA